MSFVFMMSQGHKKWTVSMNNKEIKQLRKKVVRLAKELRESVELLRKVLKNESTELLRKSLKNKRKVA